MRAFLICFTFITCTTINAQVYIYQSVGYGFDLGKDMAEFKVYEKKPFSTGQTLALMNGPNYSAGLGFALSDKLSLEVGYNYSRLLNQSLPQTASYEQHDRYSITDISLDLGAYWEYYSLMFAYDFDFSNFLITVRAGPSVFQGAVIEDIYYSETTYYYQPVNQDDSRGPQEKVIDEKDSYYTRVLANSYSTLGLHFGVKFNYQINRNIFFNLQANFNRSTFEAKEIQGIAYRKNGRGDVLSVAQGDRHFFYERHEKSYVFTDDFQPPRVINRPIPLTNLDFRVGIEFYIDKQVIDYLK